MSSAQREIQRIDDSGHETEAQPELFLDLEAGSPAVLKHTDALKYQIAEKVAAHRARKLRASGPELASAPASSPAKARASRIAEKVAERYAHSQSYRAFLAEEAEKAVRQARAVAEVAQRTAEAVAAAQYELLASLDQHTDESTTPAPAPTPLKPPQTTARPIPTPSLFETPAVPAPAPVPALRVQLFEDARFTPPHVAAVPQPLIVDEDEALALDEEIAFRQSPVFEELTPPIELPTNLIEFPRQLVAPRRARPRLAEGPLREEGDTADDSSQLRIFEVEPAQISPAPAIEASAPEWSSILLSSRPAPTMVQLQEEASLAPSASAASLPQTAPVSLRLMAAIVDGVIVTASVLVFISAFVLTASQFLPAEALRMTPQTAIITLGGILGAFAFIYQLLFFTFSESTLGMRYARIGLCTFSDDNPSRAAMRRRVFAHLLSACPLGIGYLWALLDEDRLAWHDRITRIYQRSY
ncbi:MAG TPA: RDD family protein [Edaphobacter sp.]